MAIPEAPKATPPKPETIKTVPVDILKPLNPTRALAITHTKHHTILIQDLTPALGELYTSPTGLNVEEASKLIEATPAPPTLYTLTRGDFLGTHLVAKNNDGKEVAEWKAPVMSLHAAKVTIKFLDGESAKTVQVNPIGNERISESFELNNSTYIWEAESKYHKHKHLYKIEESTTLAVSAPAPESSTSAEGVATAPVTVTKAREVARYAQKHGHHGHGKEGLLVFDSREIDELVGVLTLNAVLEQLHKDDRTNRIYDNVVGIVG